MDDIYKTRPCDKYWLYGSCSRGDRCAFYHDISERRLLGGVAVPAQPVSNSSVDNESDGATSGSSPADAPNTASPLFRLPSSAAEGAPSAPSSSQIPVPANELMFTDANAQQKQQQPPPLRSQQQQEQQSPQEPPPLPAAEDQPNSEKDEKQEQQQDEQPGLPSSFVGHRLF